MELSTIFPVTTTGVPVGPWSAARDWEVPYRGRQLSLTLTEDCSASAGEMLLHRAGALLCCRSTTTQ